MSLLRVSGICTTDESGFALQEISLVQEQGQKIAVAGETGSGKSTLLKIIAGLMQPATGEVRLEGARIKGPGEQLIPGHAHIAYLSQHYELRNHYRVGELLEMANKLTDEAASHLYELCRISHLLKRKTHQLSGGERQRIALARLLTTSPKLLVLDEPFSNLDPIHKTLLKSVIQDIAEQLNITCLLASHDPLDTLSWADHILVLKNGQLVQQGTPEQLYHRPLNEYVARLFGTCNIIAPRIGSELFAFPDQGPAGKQWMVRPEGFKVSATSTRTTVPGKVKRIFYWGSYYTVEVMLYRQFLITGVATYPSIKADDTVHIALWPEAVWYV